MTTHNDDLHSICQKLMQDHNSRHEVYRRTRTEVVLDAVLAVMIGTALGFGLLAWFVTY